MKEKLFVIFLVLLHYQYFDINSLRRQNYRLQNSAYFCVFKYGRAVKQKVWNEAENSERDWGETLKMRIGFFSLASHALRACEARALRKFCRLKKIYINNRKQIYKNTS